MPVYILSAEAISPQETFLTESFLENPVLPEGEYFTCLHPDYKQFIQPGALRRMSPVIRMGLASAMVALRNGDIEKPDAILVGTGLGCVQDTVKFLNQVIQVMTEHPPREVLDRIIQIEQGMGRVRNDEGYDSRTIDVDILYFGDQCLNLPELVVPHPRLHLRRFTLMPLAEIAGERVHPVLKKKNSELLELCTDHSSVMKFRESN